MKNADKLENASLIIIQLVNLEFGAIWPEFAIE